MCLLRKWIASVVLLLVTGPAPLSTSASEVLSLGIFAYRPVDLMTTMWEPTARFIESALGDQKVQMRILDQRNMEQAIRQGELDVVFTNPTHYIRLRAENRLSGAIATQVTIQNDQPVSELGGLVIRRGDRSEIQTLDDLEGLRVAIAGREYLGGYISQAMLLRERGVNLNDIDFVEMGGPHDKIVQAVAQGEVDAGFIRTGILESLRAAGNPIADELVVVEQQAIDGFPFVTTTSLYPEWAVVAMPHLDQDVARRLASALLSLDQTDPAAKAAGIYGFTVPEDYRPVEDAMVALRVPPFQLAPEVSWLEFADQNRLVFILGLIVLITLTATATVLVWFQRRLALAKHLTDSLNRRFVDLADNVPGALFQYRLRPDGSSHFLLASSKIKDIYGCTQKDLLEDATPAIDTIHPDDRAVVEQSIRASAEQMAVWNATYRVRHPVRGEIWVEGSSTPTLQADGSVIWHGFIEDVTELHVSRRAMRLAEQVLKATSDGVAILNEHGQVEQINPAFTSMTGYDLETLKGKRLSELEQTGVLTDVNQAQSWRGQVVWRAVSGAQLPVLLSISPVRDENAMLLHQVVVVKDISEMQAKQDELDRLAHYDALTGLPNRRLLTDRLEQAVAHAKRTGETLALAMLDLDDFKPVNDQYGHEAGDQLLIEIASRLKTAVREEDTVARLGGDEFTLILWNTKGESAFERVIQSLQEPVNLNQGMVRVSASMGVTYFDREDPLNGEQLMRQADVALYQSKEGGRNRFTVFQQDMHLS